MIAPLRLDARLFEEPPSRTTADGKKRRGRPALVGERLPNLTAVAAAQCTRWPRSRLAWYGGQTTFVDWTTGTALWYSTGTPPLRIRWVLVRDPNGERPTVAENDIAFDGANILINLDIRPVHFCATVWTKLEFVRYLFITF